MFSVKVKNKLSAVTALQTILTGGIYEYVELGEKGIARQNPNCSNAYEDAPSGRLKPCLVVKGRPLVSSGGIVDQEEQVRSLVQVVECWLYTDKVNDVSVLESAVELIYATLEGNTVEGSFTIEWFNSIRPTPDRQMEDATQFREDYRVPGLREV